MSSSERGKPITSPRRVIKPARESSDTNGMSDFRRAERRPLAVEARFEMGGRSFDCLIRDLSPLGGFVSTEEAVAPGSSIDLVIVADHDGEQRVSAQVIRCAGRKDDHIGFGVEFETPIELPKSLQR